MDDVNGNNDSTHTDMHAYDDIYTRHGEKEIESKIDAHE